MLLNSSTITDGEDEGDVHFTAGTGVSGGMGGEVVDNINNEEACEVDEMNRSDPTTPATVWAKRKFSEQTVKEASNLLKFGEFEYAGLSSRGCTERVTFLLRDERSWLHLFKARFSRKPAIIALQRLSAKGRRVWTARTTLVGHMKEVLSAWGCTVADVQATDLQRAPMSVLTEAARQFLEWTEAWCTWHIRELSSKAVLPTPATVMQPSTSRSVMERIGTGGQGLEPNPRSAAAAVRVNLNGRFDQAAQAANVSIPEMNDGEAPPPEANGADDSATLSGFNSAMMESLARVYKKKKVSRVRDRVVVRGICLFIGGFFKLQ
jgi:hypothetical protein